MKEWRAAVLENPYLNYLEWVSLIAGENKQGNISAEECREIFSKLNLKVFESEYKVLIMWMPERLGKEGNILLKLFEEPAEKTLIILVAENRDLLLSTIISRAQILSIPRIDDQSLAQAITDRHGLNPEAVAKIVRRANGNYNEALHLLNNVEDNNQELFNRWMQLLYTGDASELLKWVEEISRIGRENQKSFFLYALEFLHECIALQLMGEGQSRLHKQEVRLATWFSQHLDSDDWQSMMELFDQAHYHIERNAHPKILFMNLSLELKALINRKKLSLTN
jgi:DNA polymerase-3 subunit delta'